MRTVSDVLQNKGGSIEYTTKDGRKIKVKYLTLKNMSEYENRLQNKAIKQLCDQRDHLPPELFAEMFSKLMDKVSAGHYAFGGELCQKSLGSVTGVAELMSIMTDLSTDEVVDLIMTEGDALKPMFDEVLRRSISSHDDEEGVGEQKKS